METSSPIDTTRTHPIEYPPKHPKPNHEQQKVKKRKTIAKKPNKGLIGGDFFLMTK